MHLLKLQRQLKQLNNLIENEKTGTPTELAKQFGISERTMRSCITQLRLMGASIDYCRIRQTYYYAAPTIFKFGFEPIDVKNAEIVERESFSVTYEQIRSNTFTNSNLLLVN
jgi:predicted DNA-binding transcriptional regulator YafY